MVLMDYLWINFFWLTSEELDIYIVAFYLKRARELARNSQIAYKTHEP